MFICVYEYTLKKNAYSKIFLHHATAKSTNKKPIALLHRATALPTYI